MLVRFASKCLAVLSLCRSGPYQPRAIAPATIPIGKNFALGNIYHVNQTPTTILHAKGQTYPVVGVVSFLVQRLRRTYENITALLTAEGATWKDIALH